MLTFSDNWLLTDSLTDYVLGISSSVSSFMPHGMCYLWKPSLIGLYVVSDLLIAISYYSIPFTLIYIVRKRKDIPFNGIFFLFAAFIIFCGTGHALDIWTLWHPNYWISGCVRAATAIVSVITAIALIRLIPQILTLPSNAQMRVINQKLEQTIEELKQKDLVIWVKEKFLQTMLDNLSDGIAACDSQGKLTIFNRASKVFFGELEEIHSDEWSNYYGLYESDGKTLLKQEKLPLLRALNGESVRNFKLVTKQQSKKKRTLLANGDSIVDADGEKIGAVVAMRDISELEKVAEALRENEAKYRLIADNSEDLIATLNADRIYLYVSPSCYALLGYKPKEMLGKCLDDFLHPEDRELFARREEVCIAQSDRCTNIHRMRHKHGHYIWFESINRYLKKSNSESIISVSRDITKRKQTEDAVAQLNEELEARVKQRTAELETSNQSLKAEIIERQRIEEEIRLLQNITQSIAGAEDFEEAITLTLRQVCETGGWHYAEAWIPSSNEKVLELSSAWYSSSVELLPFREGSIHFSFPPGVEVSGRVWANQKFEWIQNLPSQDEEYFPRVKLAEQVGFKTALGVPITADHKVIAVFVFFDLYHRSENKRMVELVKSVAAQLGLIMKRKQVEDALRSSMATNRALLDAIPDWMFRFGYDGTLVNFKAPKNTHAPLISSNFIGKKLDEVLPQDVAKVMINGITEALTTKKVQICEYQLNRKTKTKDYEARIAVSDRNEVMAIVRDITERKQIEYNIRSALEKEKHLNELKTRFVTMTSHEFRTPLASILSSSELLEHYAHKWSEERKLNHLHRIQTSVKHMTGLLNDVLLLGKADAGKLALSPTEFDLYRFCREYVEEMQLITKTHQIIFNRHGCFEESHDRSTNPDDITGNRGYTVCMDEKLLRHILNNLLSNAIKYSPNSDKVYFDVTCEPKQVVFQVRDLGIGIPVEDQKHLFDSFHRASNVNSIPGTGLGLPIVKRAVDLHGGTIAMKSKMGDGTTFTVTLPNLTIK
ncbi:PAS domain S-box protein [Myxosarcina sp. GI1]|uniref:PAS domain S-box protein n=1 Tax=Myxosarcina sp. GI1 TaxID=1541065 RepID=UPI00068ABA24|nr:PAS domain S-box protein [Myxosarcina sp. GI1]